MKRQDVAGDATTCRHANAHKGIEHFDPDIVKSAPWGLWETRVSRGCDGTCWASL
jgi:hypothetical protein